MLLDVTMTTCTMLDKTTSSDGRGGIVTSWNDGAEFQATVLKNDSDAIRVGEAQGVKSVYTVTTTGGVVLGFHDVFRREEDGKIFRITGDGADTKPPKSASAIIKKVSCIAAAEEWALPTGE